MARSNIEWFKEVRRGNRTKPMEGTKRYLVFATAKMNNLIAFEAIP